MLNYLLMPLLCGESEIAMAMSKFLRAYLAYALLFDLRIPFILGIIMLIFTMFFSDEFWYIMS